MMKYLVRFNKDDEILIQVQHKIFVCVKITTEEPLSTSYMNVFLANTSLT